jgi:F-type H+-transporting ATPase subunit delta
MNEGLIPRRYAKALYKVDADRHSAGSTYGLMQSLAHSFDTNSSLHALMANPFVDNADKLAVLSTAAGATTQDTTFADFLKLLIANRRINLANQISHAYLDIYRKENNIKRIQIISAAPLDPAVLDRIKTLVARHLNGANMEFDSQIDPNLIGGFIINIDNERLDASLRNQLKELRISLLN